MAEHTTITADVALSGLGYYRRLFADYASFSAALDGNPGLADGRYRIDHDEQMQADEGLGFAPQSVRTVSAGLVTSSENLDPQRPDMAGNWRWSQTATFVDASTLVTDTTAVDHAGRYIFAPGRRIMFRVGASGTTYGYGVIKSVASRAANANVVVESGRDLVAGVLRVWIHADDATDLAVNVKMFGAVGDGSSDDTAAIQAAIDYAGSLLVGSQGAGVAVIFPNGPNSRYLCGNLILRSGVFLIGGPPVVRTYQIGPALVCKPDTDGYWIRTDPEKDIRSGGLIGLSFSAVSNNNVVGFGIGSWQQGAIHGCYFESFPKQVIAEAPTTSPSPRVSVIHITNNFMLGNRIVPTERRGTLELGGADHYLANNEIHAAHCSSVSGPGMNAVAARISCSNAFFAPGNVFECGDIGLEIIPGATLNKFNGCRVDTNAGHGVVLTGGTYSQFSDCHFHRNSRAAENTYDHINVPANGGSINIFSDCHFSNDPSGIVRYSIYDAKTSGEYYNKYVDPVFSAVGPYGPYSVASSIVSSSAARSTTVSTTTSANSGATETLLAAHKLKANMLALPRGGIRMAIWGTTANNANAKKIRVYLGAYLLAEFSPTANQLSTWRCDCHLYRHNSTSQRYAVTYAQGGTVKQTDFAAGTSTQDAAIESQLRCVAVGVADGDVTKLGHDVEMVNIVWGW